MKMVDDSRRPRRFATVMSSTAKTAMGTRHGSTSGRADVTAAMPDDTLTATVST